MGSLDSRIAVITGAGRGLGRDHALLFAAEGASVVVNDLGSGTDGAGADSSPAEETAAEIRALGGQAIANHDDVSDAGGANRLVAAAIDAFGRLDVLVNNAGILRDRMLVNMTDAEWDDVIRVHTRGHFLPLRAAANHWRERSKAGDRVNAAVINTASPSALISNPGQANYAAAKSAIMSMTEVAQKELGRYGVRCNAIAPAARTRLTAGLMGSEDIEAAHERQARETGFDPGAPANVSPLVAYLATADCPIQGKTLFVYGDKVHLYQPWALADTISAGGRRWTVGALADAAAKWGDVVWDQSPPAE